MDYTVHGILQAKILEWVASPFSRDLPNPGIKPRSPALQADSTDSLPTEPQVKPKNTGLGCLSQDSCHKGSLRILEWVAYRFSSRYSLPRNHTRVSCIAGKFFTNWATRELGRQIYKESLPCCAGFEGESIKMTSLEIWLCVWIVIKMLKTKQWNQTNNTFQPHLPSLHSTTPWLPNLGLTWS